MQVSKQRLDQRKLLDVRISRLIAWIREIFPVGQMEIRYMRGDTNKGVDILSRLRIDQPDAMAGQKNVVVNQELEQVAS